MSRKKKKAKISSEAKTAFIFAAVFLVCGIGCILFGKLWYHTDDMVTLDELETGKTATIVAVDKRDRNLSQSEKKIEKQKGRSDEELKYEYYVTYSIIDNDKEYTYADTKPYRNHGATAPEVGDTEVVNYTIKDGKLIVNPETQDVNQFVVSGWILAILGALAAGIGFFIRK